MNAEAQSLPATMAEPHPTVPDLAPQQAQAFVRATPDTASDVSDATQHKLTDRERESAIRRAGELVQQHMERYQDASRRYDISGCFVDAADRDRERLMAEWAARLMAELIRGRSAEQVARMEREQGLS